METKSVLSIYAGSFSISSVLILSSINGKYNNRPGSISKKSVISFISNSEIISERSHLYTEAISLIATSFIRSLLVNSRFAFRAIRLPSLRQCRSSVSRIRIAPGHCSATRQPNCSSVIKRSKSTTSGFKRLIKSSKLFSFNAIETFSTP